MSARRPNFLIYFLHVAAAEGLEQGDVGGEGVFLWVGSDPLEKQIFTVLFTQTLFRIGIFMIHRLSLYFLNFK